MLCPYFWELRDCDSVDILDVLGRCAALECWIVELEWGDV